MCDMCDVLHTPYIWEYIYKIVIYTFLRMRGMQKPSHKSHNRKKQLEKPVKSMVSGVRLFFAQNRTKNKKSHKSTDGGQYDTDRNKRTGRKVSDAHWTQRKSIGERAGSNRQLLENI